MNNLPDSSNTTQEVREFFNNYYTQQITFPTNQIDAVLGFFMKRGFDEQVARSTGIMLMNQAKNDGVNVFVLLDKLKSLTDVQLNQVITKIININRTQTSVLGYKVSRNDESYESRNILV